MPRSPSTPSNPGRVGVVVPLYQGLDYIDAALGSVAAQTHQPADVVVVDDGSIDGGSDAAERWADLLPITVVRHEHNQGLPAALRTGIATLGTPLIAQLDADDLWLPEHLEMLLAQYDRQPGLISADALRWIPGLSLGRRSWYQRYRVPRPDDQLASLVADNWVFGATLLSRDDYDAAGGYRDRISCEDWDLWLRMVRNGVRVSVPAYPTMLYRLRPGSVSRGDKLYIAQLDILSDFIREADDPVMQSAARSARRAVSARLHLQRAYSLARERRRFGARREAARAVRAASPTAVRAAAILALPVSAVKVYDRISSDPRWQVNR